MFKKYLQLIHESYDTGTTLAIFPGKFKPPHIGHIHSVKEALGRTDEVQVIISPKEQDGFTAEKSIAIWTHLLKNPKVIFSIGRTPSPVGDTYDFLEKGDVEKYSKIYLIKSSKDLGDTRFAMDRLQKAIAKNPKGSNIAVGEMLIEPLQNSGLDVSSSSIRPLLMERTKENENAIKQLYNTNDEELLNLLFGGNK